MKQQYQELLRQAYDGFNRRDIDAVLLLFDKEVHWPNGWEGGYVKGHDEVRNYWTRQWKEINPIVKPLSYKENEDGQIEVEVHQLAKDLDGKVLFDSTVNHVYTFSNGKVKSMDIKNHPG